MVGKIGCALLFIGCFVLLSCSLKNELLVDELIVFPDRYHEMDLVVEGALLHNHGYTLFAYDTNVRSFSGMLSAICINFSSDADRDEAKNSIMRSCAIRGVFDAEDKRCPLAGCEGTLNDAEIVWCDDSFK